MCIFKCLFFSFRKFYESLYFYWRNKKSYEFDFSLYDYNILTESV